MNATVTHKILQSVSNLLHPLLMLTYGAIGLTLYTPIQAWPQAAKWFIVGPVVLYTFLLPVVSIWLLYRFGIVGHWALRDRRDRALPLLVNAICYAICAVGMSRLPFMPDWALSIFCGATAMAFTCWIVSFWWKISAHATGIASLTTAAYSLALMFPVHMPLWIPLLLTVLTGALCSIRIYLGRHTMAQVAAGTALGIVSIVVALFIVVQ